MNLNFGIFFISGGVYKHPAEEEAFVSIQEGLSLMEDLKI